MRHRCTMIAALPLLLFAVLSGDAAATPVSESTIFGTTFVTDSGTTSSAVTLGANSASSFVNPLSETMGGSVSSDGTAFSVRTDASTFADWTCDSCSALSPPLDISATILFDVLLSPNIPEFSLVGKYGLGLDVFSFFAAADSSPMGFGATWDNDPLQVTSTTDANGNIRLTTLFTRTFICPCFANNLPQFSDFQSLAIEMEGRGFIDASHTFSVSLASSDPNVVLTSSDGRTIGSTQAAPVPEPASMLLLGTGLAAIAPRCRKKIRGVPREVLEK